ncbi:hypothetical protein Taro_052416 [Colocasia esculenta]|uniref:DUF4228 domain-containing protein n=1 Tax=Colocasia esculenta TaxID=4460 RepID=A0A843XJL3_COLES|nr:hypothetical protein [Colocasia esculenta]
MGIKLLILQMIPWCFPMMGNTSGCHQAHQHVAPSSPKVATAGDDKASKHLVKLIMADGTVEVYNRPVSAAELMMSHPMHFVCRSDAFTIGQRIPALEEGEQLQPGHAYFLLPAHFFQSVLSFVTLASAIALLQQRPFDVHKTPSGSLQIRLSDEVVGKAEEAQEGEGGGRWEGGGRVCTTAALEKDYRQLVAESRARQWKPKLETIKESGRGRGRLVAVGGAAAALGDIGRRRKKGHQKQRRQQQEEEEQLQQKQQEQRGKQQRRPQQKAEDHKVSTVSHLLGSPHPLRSKGKKVVACDL